MVVGGAFGVAGGQVAPVFDPVEAAFDDVALLVGLRVEVRWSPAVAAFGGRVARGDLTPGLPQNGT